jgi:(E)-4-hydroxy-3-methylbut-2-enyl-diphosphate synthase
MHAARHRYAMRPLRKKTRPVRVRDLVIGGDSPVSIQTMTNVPLEDVQGTINQVRSLVSGGAQLVRLAVMNESSLEQLKKVRKALDVPLSADVHFNYRIALGAIECGIDKVRINPGNIGSPARVREVVKAASERLVPIRVGVNGGSLDRNKYPEVTPAALAESALEHVKILEDNGFNDIVVSIKSSDIIQTVEANKLFSGMRDYPLHIGLTEAGYGISCVVQSSVLIGHLLMLGLGDTVRVSMTGDPADELNIAKKILASLGERREAVRIIACPTCGRTDPSIDLSEIAQEIEERITSEFSGALDELKREVVIAVMGCEVNGPGEASHAHVGIAGARSGNFLLFARGERRGKIARHEVMDTVRREVSSLIGAWRAGR